MPFSTVALRSVIEASLGRKKPSLISIKKSTTTSETQCKGLCFLKIVVTHALAAVERAGG